MADLPGAPPPLAACHALGVDEHYHDPLGGHLSYAAVAAHGPSGGSLTTVAPAATAPAHSAAAAAIAAAADASMCAAGLGLPGYPTCTGALALAVDSAAPSPNRVSRPPPLGFQTSRPSIPHVTWAPTAPPADSAMAAAIDAIQAAVAVSQERQRSVSLA